MSAVLRFFLSTIGRKYVVGLTGLGLSLFVLVHMLGNLLIFAGADAYNRYAHGLEEFPLIFVVELGLLALFLCHIVLAVYLTFENKRARPEGYLVEASGDKATSLIQKTMFHQGVVLLVFVVYHLITFKWGPYYETVLDGEMVRDIYRLVVEVFQQPFYVVGYLFCLVVLGLHLSHGVSSAVRTLGFNHPAYDPMVRWIGRTYAFVVSVGFLCQPIYVYFFY